MVSKYHQKHRERLRHEARERYQNLSKVEKDKMQIKARERYQHFTEKEKEKRGQYYQKRIKKLPECKRNYYLAHEK